MLVQLLIQDIVLIDNLDIEFNSGLSVLTGETGAGKSILLDALSIALGARGDGNLVRAGAANGQVRAVFSLPVDHYVFSILEQGEILSREELLADGGFCNLILRRVQSADGRTRAFINENPVSVSILRDIGHLLVEIHGQHDERALVDGDKHRLLLDAFGGLSPQVEMVRQAWKIWSAARKEFESLEIQIEKAAREAEYLRSSVAELEKLSPVIGEESELASQRQSMMQAQNIAGELAEASKVLSGKGSAAPALASLVRKLENKKQQVPDLLDGVIEQLDGALTHLYAAQSELEGSINRSEFDAQTLDDAEERLFSLRAAARKYNVAVENLPELAAQLTANLHDLDHGEARLKELKSQCDESAERYQHLADDLTTKRKISGDTLAGKVAGELPSLKLDQAEFIIEHESGGKFATGNGQDKIEFWVRTNPGTRAGPMFKVASGGELSRFLLALKVVLAEKGSAPTLVFDEIDTGVGGAVADAIGRRLLHLSNSVQVLSVTHAPQVAAKAGQHFLISKSFAETDARQVTTGVVHIENHQRRDEIARMLAGASISEEARAAADVLIDAVS